MGQIQIGSKSRGLLQGRLTAASGNDYAISTQGIFVPNSNVSLFSVPVANHQGHTVKFEGSPWSGVHGLYFKDTEEWVPFQWDEGTGLYWLAVDRDPHAAYGTTAQGLDPHSAVEIDG